MYVANFVEVAIVKGKYVDRHALPGTPWTILLVEDGQTLFG